MAIFKDFVKGYKNGTWNRFEGVPKRYLNGAWTEIPSNGMKYQISNVMTELLQSESLPVYFPYYACGYDSRDNQPKYNYSYTENADGSITIGNTGGTTANVYSEYDLIWNSVTSAVYDAHRSGFLFCMNPGDTITIEAVDGDVGVCVMSSGIISSKNYVYTEQGDRYYEDADIILDGESRSYSYNGNEKLLINANDSAKISVTGKRILIPIRYVNKIGLNGNGSPVTYNTSYGAIGNFSYFEMPTATPETYEDFGSRIMNQGISEITIITRNPSRFVVELMGLYTAWTPSNLQANTDTFTASRYMDSGTLNNQEYTTKNGFVVCCCNNNQVEYPLNFRIKDLATNEYVPNTMFYMLALYSNKI